MLFKLESTGPYEMLLRDMICCVVMCLVITLKAFHGLRQGKTVFL